MLLVSVVRAVAEQGCRIVAVQPFILSVFFLLYLW